jgi:tight adherence protein B
MTDIRVLLLAGGAAVLMLVVFLVVRAVLEARRARRERRLHGTMEDSGVLVRGAVHPPTPDLAGRIDEGFERLVQRSGVESSPEQILGLIVLFGVVIGTALYLWREQIALAVGGLVLGMLVPLVVLWFLKGRYQRQLQAQLPDALYLIARSLRAGLSLEQAIELVGDDGPRPMGAEFQRCSATLRLNLPLVTALEKMDERIQLVDFTAFVSVVSFHQRTGGNLPLLLDRLAAGARDRNQFRGQFWASTAQGRITSVALAAAAPLLLIGYALFQPDFVQSFVQDSRGIALLIGVAILQIIGIIWIYRILKVDY